MYLTAKALGYAAKIETSPARVCRNDTETYNDVIGINDEMSARAFLIVGYAAEAPVDGEAYATQSSPISATHVD